MSSRSVDARQRSLKPEGPAETSRRLEDLFQRGFNTDYFEGIELDQYEVARFVAEKARILNVAALAAGLSSVSWMIENTFYSAYLCAQSAKKKPIDFASTTDDVL